MHTPEMGGRRVFDPDDVRVVVWVAHVTSTERRVVEEHDEDRPDFTAMRKMMCANTGTL